MALGKFTLREIHSRPGRAALTLGSIVIGVAAVVAVTLSTATTHRAYQEMYESLTGRASLEVIAEGGGVFDEEVVASLEEIPGVETVVPLIQQPSILYFGDHRVRLLVLGIDPQRDETVRDYELQQGSFFAEGRGALMEFGFAQSLGIAVGDEIRILANRARPVTLKVMGLLSPRGAAGFNQGGVVFLPLRLTQTIFRQPRSINTASLVLANRADEKKVRADVADRLPTGLAVRTPAARTQLARQTILNAEYGLSLAYALTLVLASFMILNTFLMNVQERRPQLAVLRALGATRGQITGMLLREGLIMGITGSLLGATLGVGGAYLLTAAMAHVYSAQMPPIRLSPQPFLLAATLGPGFSLLAAYIPARLAGRVPPLEGMRPAIVDEQAPLPRGFVIAGITAFAVTGLVLVACMLQWLPLRLAIPAGVGFMVAFIVLIPVVLRPLSRITIRILAPLLGPEGRLAQRQVVRRRTRTALTIGLLYIAVGSGIGLGTTILANVADIRDWQRQTIVGDFFIRAMFPDLATGQAAELPESLAAQIAQVPGVGNISTVRFVDATMGDQPIVAVLHDFPAQEPLPLALKEGDPDDVRQRLAQGEVVVGTVLAKKAGVGVGDWITIDTRRGAQPLRVAGITTEYLVGGLVVHLNRNLGKRLYDVRGVDVFMVQTAPGTVDQAREGLKALCDQRGLMLHSFADLRRRLDSLMDGVVGSLWGLLGLGFVVAGFAVANTLTMNVLEQTRDIALLRVVAMTRAQVRKEILSQATIIGVIGLLTGIAGGLTGAYVINLVMAAALGSPLDFALYPRLILSVFACGMAIVLLAAWLPARRASRLNLLLALHYE